MILIAGHFDTLTVTTLDIPSPWEGVKGFKSTQAIALFRTLLANHRLSLDTLPHTGLVTLGRYSGACCSPGQTFTHGIDSLS